MSRLVFTFMLLLAGAVHAQDRPDLYAATHLVTGREMVTRIDGLAAGLRDVLVKLSGDPALLDADVAAVAPDLLESYFYLDRMSDLPHHDEQGTRDRPYFLHMEFAPAKVDALLLKFGDHVWHGRPRLQVRLAITDQSGVHYKMTSDGDDDERHRQGLAAAAERFGVRLLLVADKVSADPPLPDAMRIDGDMHWSDADFGWVGTWRSGDRKWGIKGVSFDAAYRNLVLGAMAIATGHAIPDQAAQ